MFKQESRQFTEYKHVWDIALAAAIPWLNPLSMGPTPQTIQWLVSAFCTAYLCIVITTKNNCLLSSAIPRLTYFFYGLTFSSIASAIIGLAQYFGVANIFGQFASSAALGEAYANLRQRNQFATLLNIGLATAFWWSVLITSIEKSNFSKMGLILLTVAVLTAANAATVSRTGLLQMLLMSSIFSWWSMAKVSDRRQKVQLLTIVALMSYMVASVILPQAIGLDIHRSGLLHRFNDNTAACQSRLILWSNVLNLISQKPWAGWGWGELAYAHFVNLYPGDRFCDILDNAHNLPLHLAVTLGIPVAAVFCAACIWLIAREKPWKEQDPMRQLAWMILVLIGLHSLLEYPLWYGPFQMTVLMCIYILWKVPASWRPASDQDLSAFGSSPRVVWGLGLAAVLVLVGCVYAAWDYWRISQIYTVPAQRALDYREDTLKKIQGSWMFRDQVRFAELNVAPLTKDNADHINVLAKEVLHFSPEPSVVKKLIASATLLGRDEEAAYYLQRFKAAFPGAKL